MERWIDHTFESSSLTTEEFRTFTKDYKAWIKDNLPPGAELAAYNQGHFYISGFIKRGPAFVYFSCSDVRFFPGEWDSNILIRTAKGPEDYSGGQNKFTTRAGFKEAVEELLRRGELQ